MNYLDQEIVEQELSQLALLYSCGDRAELGRDLRRLRESDSPRDRAIIAGWDKFLRETRANIAAKDQARVDAAQAILDAAAARAEVQRIQAETAARRIEAGQSDPLIGLLVEMLRWLRIVAMNTSRADLVGDTRARFDAMGDLLDKVIAARQQR